MSPRIRRPHEEVSELADQLYWADQLIFEQARRIEALEADVARLTAELTTETTAA